jgi:flagellar basal body P-ring formation protein FlgA
MTRYALSAALVGALILAPRSQSVARPPPEASSTVRAAILAALPPVDAQTAQITHTAARVMARCAAPLTVSFLSSGEYRTAQVTCPAPRWTLYVEVAIGRDESVLVATHAIGMGQPIEVGDFRIVRMPANDIAGAVITAEQATGLAAASPIAVGQTITRRNVAIPLAVRNGEPVTVHIESGSTDVTMTGTALQSGGLGESILVDNRVSNKRITAVIAEDNVRPPAGRPFILVSR